jgi:CheY-like chemotaxis protein
MLKKLGHRVMIARGGEEAVMMYRMNRDHVDLVVMDMIMPDMNGGEAIEKIKAINPHAKVLLSSGYSINGMARKIMDRCGVEGFLQKPFQVDQLVGKINEVMGAENIKHENGDF